MVIGHVTKRVVRGVWVLGVGAFLQQNPSFFTPGRGFQKMQREHRHRFSDITLSYSPATTFAESALLIEIYYQKRSRESIPPGGRDPASVQVAGSFWRWIWDEQYNRNASHSVLPLR